MPVRLHDIMKHLLLKLGDDLWALTNILNILKLLNAILDSFIMFFLSKSLKISLDNLKHLQTKKCIIISKHKYTCFYTK